MSTKCNNNPSLLNPCNLKNIKKIWQNILYRGWPCMVINNNCNRVFPLNKGEQFLKGILHNRNRFNRIGIIIYNLNPFMDWNLQEVSARVIINFYSIPSIILIFPFFHFITSFILHSPSTSPKYIIYLAIPLCQGWSLTPLSKR